MQSVTSDLNAKIDEQAKANEGLQAQNQDLQAQIDELNNLKSKAMSERTVPPAVRQALVLEILGKIAHLECDEITDMIGTLVRTVHDQYPSTHEGAQHAGLTALLA